MRKSSSIFIDLGLAFKIDDAELILTAELKDGFITLTSLEEDVHVFRRRSTLKT